MLYLTSLGPGTTKKECQNWCQNKGGIVFRRLGPLKPRNYWCIFPVLARLTLPAPPCSKSLFTHFSLFIIVLLCLILFGARNCTTMLITRQFQSAYYLLTHGNGLFQAEFRTSIMLDLSSKLAMYLFTCENSIRYTSQQ